MRVITYTNRTQSVIVNGCKSSQGDVISGIPQGTVLGPVLFLIYINDLPSLLQSMLFLFADDAKLFSKISNVNSNVVLQSDLDRALHWSEQWQLPFNADKCKSMHLGTNNPYYVYKMNDIIIEQVEKMKDIGVTFDNKLTFHHQAATAAKKANQVLAIIKKSFAFLDPTTLILLYTSLVRPHLGYANVIWGPRFKMDQDLLEQVQRRATKLISDVKDMPYIDRLKYLKLSSLAYRRRRRDMITVYQIFNNRIDLNWKQFFKLSPTVGLTRGHDLKLFKSQSNKELRRNYFSNRVIKDWNSLPYEVIHTNSLNSFKCLLDCYWTDSQYDF